MSETVSVTGPGLLPVVASVPVPWGVTLSAVGRIGSEYVGLTALAFVLGVTVLAVGVFRFDFLDADPAARTTLVDALDDAVFVLDCERRLVETNAAGCESPCLRPGVDDPVGEPLQSVLRDGVTVQSILENETAEFSLRIDGDRRYFWTRKKPIDRPGTGDRTLVTVTDVTERRQRERGTDRLESLVEASPVATVTVGPEGDVTRKNAAAEEVFGRFEVDGLDEFDPVGPDGRQDGRGDLSERILAGESFSERDLRHQAGDGSEVDVTLSTAPLYDAGEVTEMVAFLDDSTDREEALRELSESERSLRDLYRITSDTDLSFERKLNQILELGRDRLDLPFAFLTRVDDDEQYIVDAIGSHDRLQAGASEPLSETYCRRTIKQAGLLGVQDAVDEGWTADPAYDRFELGCYLGGTVVVNQELYGTLCFAGNAVRERSFTRTERVFVELLVQWVSYELERDRLEGKLRDLQTVAGELVEADSIDEIGDIAVESAEEVLDLEVTGIWRCDDQQAALRPIAETSKARQLFGSIPRFEGGRSLTWEVFEQGEMAVFEDVSTVEGRYREDTDVRTEVIIPLDDLGVMVTGSVSEREFSNTDIELFELFASTVSSAMRRAERERELRETRAELRRSNEDLEQFASAASHDLQEPLRTVSMYLDLLVDRHGDELDGDARDFVDVAVDGADRMHEMIQGLLEYSRTETRGDPFEPTELQTVYEKARRNLRVAIEERDATVTADELPAVQGDEAQLVQLLQNLLDNAITYQGDDRPRVHVSARRADSRWVISVADNGIGMSPEETERAFQIFERHHGREAYPGTGLGLAMCRKIVERHGGDIRVDSEPTDGSTFHFSLPAALDDR